jgi:hypothetical protein
MRKVHGIKVELGCVLERQAIVILAITIVVWLQRIDILVEDLVRAEFFVATKCRWVLILESALYPIGLIIGNILALTLPPKLASLAGI